MAQTKWEYAIVKLIEYQDRANLNRLIAMGIDGWELVSVNNDIAYFKRPIWNPE